MANSRFARFDSGAAPGGGGAPENYPDQTPPAPSPTGAGFSLGMVYYTLFRHKGKIAICALTGVLAAGLYYKTTTVPFTSGAKVLIKYVEERQDPIIDDGAKVKTPDSRGETIINTEVQILGSYDLAVEVARTLGPETVLAGTGVEPTEQRAAAFIYGGLGVESQRRSSVIDLRFSSKKPDNVQKILTQVVNTYLRRHAEAHRSGGVRNDALTQETDQLRAKLNETEEELRRLLERAGVISIDDAKRTYVEQAATLQGSIMSAEAELAGVRAALGTIAGARTPQEAPDTASATPLTPPSAEAVTVYRQVSGQLNLLYQRERELLSQFTPETPMVKGIRAQIEENEKTKARLLNEFPGLATQTIAPAGRQASDSGVFDPAVEAARIRAAESKIGVMRTQLETVRGEMTKLGAVESQIGELQRRRELLAKQYNYFAENLEKKRIDVALGSVSNLSVIQTPSPPVRNSLQQRKIAAGIMGGGLVLGLALAFGIEMFLDQSVKRPGEIESTLGLPLVLTIPRMKRKQMRAAAEPKLLEAGPGSQKPGGKIQESEASSPSSGSAALTPWSADHELRTFFDALRNRLIYSFEMRAITRKPKLVAVTSCGADSGVSTVAAGLAASLSETGDGNVLLVDMNPDRKTPQFFHKGDLKVGLDDVLAEDTRDDAMVRENLYMVSQQTAEDRLSWIMPKKFAQLIPRMKASDFDYIIFDMPPVSQISATPQLARYMDQVLMVVESEKTNRDAVKRAGAMLADAGANVGVVLNKTKSYVPRALDHDALAS